MLNGSINQPPLKAPDDMIPFIFDSDMFGAFSFNEKQSKFLFGELEIENYDPAFSPIRMKFGIFRGTFHDWLSMWTVIGITRMSSQKFLVQRWVFNESFGEAWKLLCHEIALCIVRRNLKHGILTHFSHQTLNHNILEMMMMLCSLQKAILIKVDMKCLYEENWINSKILSAKWLKFFIKG